MTVVTFSAGAALIVKKIICQAECSKLRASMMPVRKLGYPCELKNLQFSPILHAIFLIIIFPNLLFLD